jgi:hypothetical protein
MPAVGAPVSRGRNSCDQRANRQFVAGYQLSVLASARLNTVTPVIQSAIVLPRSVMARAEALVDDDRSDHY